MVKMKLLDRKGGCGWDGLVHGRQRDGSLHGRESKVEGMRRDSVSPAW